MNRPRFNWCGIRRGIQTLQLLKAISCQNCIYVVQPNDSTGSVLICANKSDSAGTLCCVEPEGTCRNFQSRQMSLAQERLLSDSSTIRYIPLTQGKLAIVDAEDYDWLSQYKWCAARAKNTFYATRTERKRGISMHRIIMNAPKGLMCDHIDHNGLNNRKSNLRLCTPAQNVHNKRPQRDSSSKYKGVGWKKRSRKWEARIRFQGKLYHLGDFTDEIKAALAYDDKAIELFGEFAYLNFPERIDLQNWIKKIIWAA